MSRREATRTLEQVVVAAQPSPFAGKDAADHLVHPLGFLGAGHPRRHLHDDAVTHAVRGDGPATPSTPDNVNCWLNCWKLIRHIKTVDERKVNFRGPTRRVHLLAQVATRVGRSSTATSTVVCNEHP